MKDVVLFKLKEHTTYIEDDIIKIESADKMSDCDKKDYVMTRMGDRIDRDIKFNGFSRKDKMNAGKELYAELKAKLKKEGKI
jgi:hypothetical protein